MNLHPDVFTMLRKIIAGMSFALVLCALSDYDAADAPGKSQCRFRMLLWMVCAVVWWIQ